MAKIIVKQAHSLSAADARDALTSFGDDLKKFGAALAWKGNSANIKGVGVSGTLKISDGSADLELKLGMLAKAAGVDAARLQASIEKRLRKALTGEA